MQSNNSSIEKGEDSQELLGWKEEGEKTQSITLFIGSWNMHGKASPSESIECFIPVGEYDMYVVGTQECERSIEASLVMPTDKSEWESKVRDTMGPDYEMVASRNFGALDLVIMIRTSLKDIISNVNSDVVSTGFGNVLNNKGAIGIGLYVGDTSFLFINSHFAAYHDNVAARNEDFHRINQNLFNAVNNLNIFGAEAVTRVPATESFDRVFWFGDLNYRINGDRSTVEKLIQSARLDILLPHDQLLKAKKKGQVFKDFIEAPITFPPTYKFDTGTDLYDTSPKGRIPAWTDRVLHKKNPFIKQKEYNSVSKLSFSDHKPVYATFEVKYSVDGGSPHHGVSEKNSRRKKFFDSLCKCSACVLI